MEAKKIKKGDQVEGQLTIFNEVHSEVEVLKKKVKKKTTLDDKIKEFNILLDNQPNQNWIKHNKNFGNKYLPIRIVEALLKSVFGAIQIKQSADTMIVSDNLIYHVDVLVYHPILKEWLTYSGIGAAPLYSNKDGMSIALHGNAPLARAYAVTNAVKSIGRLFGSSINNLEDEMIDVYDPEFKKLEKPKGDSPEVDRMKKMLAGKHTKESLSLLLPTIKKLDNQEVLDLYNAKKSIMK